MKTYLLNIWDRVRTSYWFVPTLFALGAVLLSLILPVLDAQIVESNVSLPESIRTTAETARVTLSAIAGAMVTVTGTVFSITIVTLSLTSQQFGPRLIRRFMYDLPTQVTLGVFLSTGLFCLLVLRVVEHQDGSVTAPHLSVIAAVVLTILSMAMLIVFIHHVAMLIQAPRIVASVAEDLDDAINRLFPEKIGEATETEQQRNGAEARDQAGRLGEVHFVIPATHEGYIQAIDGDGLMEVAAEHDLVLRLRLRPGHFVARDAPFADVWHGDGHLVEKLSVDDLTTQMNERIITDIRRTPRQDVECAIEELVEVAVRSLSPGINDPFTAVNCIDRLGASLGRLAERKLPPSYRCDKEGKLRVIAHPVAFAEALDAAFDQIRQYGRRSVSVTVRLLEALVSIAAHIHREDDRIAVKVHAEMIARHAESLSEVHDRQAVTARFERVKRLLEAGEGKQ